MGWTDPEPNCNGWCLCVMYACTSLIEDEQNETATVEPVSTELPVSKSSVTHILTDTPHHWVPAECACVPLLNTSFHTICIDDLMKWQIEKI